jgi:DNA invertase Pin-like site-specific DNA recombinase
MNSTNLLHSKTTPDHRAKLAYVYLRQSTPGQVQNNTESTTRQYALVERAVALGWPRDRVQVIDEDLGCSGSSTDLRSGFQQLMTEVGLAHVGLVLSLEASRLSRNNSDWCHLLELCSIFGTLIADAEIVYDPRIYHDRLLLGLAGIMSEAELHQIKMRLDAGKRSKAARGELRLPLPAGLERLRTGEIIFHPDEEIQARLRLIFDKFRELGSAGAVMRYLKREGLKVPARSRKGPWPQDVLWGIPTASGVREIIQNPAYAGAYVYGRKIIDHRRRHASVRRSGIVRKPIDTWEVCLQDVYPAYLSWEEFVANQKRIAGNQNNYFKNKQGVPRAGQALLQGIVLCGRCGYHLSVHYGGQDSTRPYYVCGQENREYGSPKCQLVPGSVVDEEVERLLLAALEPDRVAVALGALAQLEREGAALERQWKLRIERVRYEASRAQRQYEACEPENRLVARSLEHLWEEKLRVVEQVEKEFEVWRKQHQAVLTDKDRQQILALGENLPKLWSAPSTTNADRKQIIRLVIKDVIVDRTREPGKVWFKINWQTGASTEHRIDRRLGSYRQYADLESLRTRISELKAAAKSDIAIATMLKAEGYRAARGEEFNGASVCYLRHLWGIRTHWRHEEGRNPRQWDDGTYSVQGAAEAIGVRTLTVHDWLRQGRLNGQQLAKGAPWRIMLTEEQIAELRGYADRVRRRRRKQLE